MYRSGLAGHGGCAVVSCTASGRRSVARTGRRDRWLVRRRTLALDGGDAGGRGLGRPACRVELRCAVAAGLGGARCHRQWTRGGLAGTAGPAHAVPAAGGRCRRTAGAAAREAGPTGVVRRLRCRGGRAPHTARCGRTLASAGARACAAGIGQSGRDGCRTPCGGAAYRGDRLHPPSCPGQGTGTGPRDRRLARCHVAAHRAGSTQRRGPLRARPGAGRHAGAGRCGLAGPCAPRA